MKIRKTLILIIIVFAVTLSSCTSLNQIERKSEIPELNVLPADFSYNNDSNDRPIKNQYHGEVFEDGCIYYYDGKTIVRYNIETNKRTYVCMDPICTHDNDKCPLYSYLECHYYNGKWYMLKSGCREDGSRYRYYSCYDPKTGKESVFAENETNTAGGMSISSQVYYENYLYYYDVLYTDATDDEPEKYSFVLRRVSLDGGTPETIMSFDDKGYGRGWDILLFADGGKIYLCEVSKGVYYILPDGSDGYAKHYIYESDDPDFAQLLECCQLIGNDLIIGDVKLSSEGDAAATEFYKVSLDGTRTDIATIEGNAYQTYFTDQYIYFQKDEGRRCIGYLQAKNEVNSGPLELNILKIYRMDYEGNIETVFDGFSDETPYATCEIGGSMTVIGDYLYIQYRNVGPEKKEVYIEGVDSFAYLSGFLRLNIKTGEMIYVSGRS